MNSDVSCSEAVQISLRGLVGSSLRMGTTAKKGERKGPPESTGASTEKPVRAGSTRGSASGSDSDDESPVARRSKRNRAEAATQRSDSVTASATSLGPKELFVAIAKVVDRISDADWTAIFWRPVDEERDGAVGYYAKVRDPVCLELIYSRLERGVYADVPEPPVSVRPKARRGNGASVAPAGATTSSASAVVGGGAEGKRSRTLRGDLERILHNSVAYNGVDSFVTDLARRVLREFGPLLFPLLSGGGTEALTDLGRDADELVTADDPLTAAVEAERVFGTSVEALAGFVKFCEANNVRVVQSGAHCCVNMAELSEDVRRKLSLLRRDTERSLSSSQQK
jgi:hypothetical protein